MGYLRCEACGAKALSAASTCPRCAAPFSLHDGRGERVALKQCSGCGIMHRRDRACHWCGERPVSAWRSPAVLKSATGIAAVALVAVGSWTMREPTADLLARVFTSRATAAADAVPLQTVATTRPEAALASAVVTPMTSIDSTASIDDPIDMPAEAADSIRWIPAVARTWVNVRSDASRGGDVVGVIKPSEKAMLGVGRAGWRQVRSPDVTGWVDPRLFEADSLRIRG